MSLLIKTSSCSGRQPLVLLYRSHQVSCDDWLVQSCWCSVQLGSFHHIEYYAKQNIYSITDIPLHPSILRQQFWITWRPASPAVSGAGYDRLGYPWSNILTQCKPIVTWSMFSFPLHNVSGAIQVVLLSSGPWVVWVEMGGGVMVKLGGRAVKVDQYPLKPQSLDSSLVLTKSLPFNTFSCITVLLPLQYLLI